VRLSSMADYAVVTMAAAARHCGSAAAAAKAGAAGAAGAPLPNAAGLAAETGLPAPTVAKLVTRLTAAGLLRASRGARGGLRLARPAAAISLADIIEAVEGPIALAACCEEGRHDCTLEEACAVRPRWGPVNAALRGALAAVPLTQMAMP